FPYFWLSELRAVGPVGKMNKETTPYERKLKICMNWEFLGINNKPSTSCHWFLLLANGSYALALGRDTKPGHHGFVRPDSRRENLIFCTIRNFIHALQYEPLNIKHL